MPFRIGLSGLNAAQADLKVTGNNIANVGTVGFKQSRAEFADVYATSKFGSVSTAIGSGVRLANAAQQFTQGNIVFTENNLDLGITGEGFFTMEDTSGNRVYTRNGQFKVDNNGFIVDNNGSNLLGFGTTATRAIDTGNITQMQITSTAIPPNATSLASIFANIDSSEPIIGATGGITFDATTNTVDPTTYNHTTSFTSYDSLGNRIQTSLFFRKTAANTWDVGVMYADASTPTTTFTNNFAAGTVQQISFNTAGTIDAAASTPALTGTDRFSFDAVVNTGAATPQTITFDLTDVTQYGADFGVTNLSQDGYTTGQLSGVDVAQNGTITARFTNGQAQNMGQIIMTGFTNEQGLSQLGDNYWAETFASGTAVNNVPGAGNLGLINSGALEDANVNLTEQLINLITAQRNFQANAKTISTADTVTQTLIQI